MGLPRQFRSTMQILSATGFLTEEKGKSSLNLSIIVSRLRDNGIELLGGICSSAKVIAAEIVFEAMDDLLIRRDVDRNTGLHLWTEMFSANNPLLPKEDVRPAIPMQSSLQQSSLPDASNSVISNPPEQKAISLEPTHQPQLVDTKQSWAEAVMASVKAAAEIIEEPEENLAEEPYRLIQAGDILEHQQFGRCIVQRVDADQEFVTVRLRNGRLVRLNLEVLNLHYKEEEEGHQVFVTGSNSNGS